MKTIQFRVNRFRKEIVDLKPKRVFDSESVARFQIEDELVNPSSLRALHEEFAMFGQLSKIKGVQVDYVRKAPVDLSITIASSFADKKINSGNFTGQNKED